jgi:hypothetical protein
MAVVAGALMAALTVDPMGETVVAMETVVMEETGAMAGMEETAVMEGTRTVDTSVVQARIPLIRSRLVSATASM